MLRSMTGYGRGEFSALGKKVTAEIRSVNHRFLDVSVRMPRMLIQFENNIKKLVAACTFRGKVEVNIQVESELDAELDLSINMVATRQVCGLLEDIKNETAVGGSITLETLLLFKDFIITQNQGNTAIDEYWDTIKSGLETALSSAKQMQETEGLEISKDIEQRLKSISVVIDEIEARFPSCLAQRQEELRQRILKLCENVELDEARIVQETAVMADRSDITEEIIRAKSHIKQFLSWIGSQEDTIGRKLEFLLQEINREVNTIGSKASDSEISMQVVTMKNELEKMREQIQNVM